MTAKQTRFGSYAREDTLPLIEEFSKKYRVSRAAIAETLVVGLLKGQLRTDEEIAAIVESGKAYIKAHRVDGRKKRGELLSALHKLPVDQLEKLIASK